MAAPLPHWCELITCLASPLMSSGHAIRSASVSVSSIRGSASSTASGSGQYRLLPYFAFSRPWVWDATRQHCLLVSIKPRTDRSVTQTLVVRILTTVRCRSGRKFPESYAHRRALPNYGHRNPIVASRSEFVTVFRSILSCLYKSVFSVCNSHP